MLSESGLEVFLDVLQALKVVNFSQVKDHDARSMRMSYSGPGACPQWVWRPTGLAIYLEHTWSNSPGTINRHLIPVTSQLRQCRTLRENLRTSVPEPRRHQQIGHRHRSTNPHISTEYARNPSTRSRDSPERHLTRPKFVGGEGGVSFFLEGLHRLAKHSTRLRFCHSLMRAYREIYFTSVRGCITARTSRCTLWAGSANSPTHPPSYPVARSSYLDITSSVFLFASRCDM